MITLLLFIIALPTLLAIGKFILAAVLRGICDAAIETENKANENFKRGQFELQKKRDKFEVNPVSYSNR